MKNIRLLLMLSPLFFMQTAIAEDIRIGVLAPRGELKALQRWTEFGNYLGETTGQSVKIVPLAPPKVIQAAKNKEVNFVLSHPPHTVILQEKLGGKPLATLNKKSGSQFAGVIIAKKGSGISKASDLRGKKVMSLKFKVAAGAYIFQTYHLKKKGIDVHSDFAFLKQGKKQDDLVLGVQAGVIDAAFVRSGLLEAMEKEGKIKVSDFVIVDQRKDKNFKLLHTTVLYPEWYLTSLKGNSPTLSKKVKTAARQMKSDTKASKTAKINGFIDPISLTGMKSALKSLKIAPYDS